MPPKKQHTLSASSGQDAVRGRSRSRSGSGTAHVQAGGDAIGRLGSRTQQRQNAEAGRGISVVSPATSPRSLSPTPSQSGTGLTLRGRTSRPLVPSDRQPHDASDIAGIQTAESQGRQPTRTGSPGGIPESDSPPNTNAPDRDSAEAREAGIETDATRVDDLKNITRHLHRQIGQAGLTDDLKQINDIAEQYRSRKFPNDSKTKSGIQNPAVRSSQNQAQQPTRSRTAPPANRVQAAPPLPASSSKAREAALNAVYSVRKDVVQKEKLIEDIVASKTEFILNAKKQNAIESVAKVQQSTDRALRLTNHLLDFSDAESAKTALALTATLADIHGLPLDSPVDPTPQIRALQSSMRTEDRTRIGFEIEVGQKYDFGRDTDPAKLEQIVNQTLYRFTPVYPNGTYGEPILEMVLDDVKIENQYPTAQIEFRTTPQDFENLNPDLKANIDDAISSFPQRMAGEEVRTTRGVWQPTQLTEDNVQTLRTAKRLQGRLTAKPVQHATVSIELNAFTRITPEQKALLYTQGASANNEAQLTAAISAHTGNDGIDATTTGRNNAGIMVKTPVEAILAVRPDLSVTPASGVKGLRQMREQEVSEVQISRTAQYVVPKTATGTQLIRTLGFPGIQGEHGIGYRAIAEKLQSPLLDTVSGGTRVLVEHRGNSEGSLAYKVNAALNGRRDTLDTVRDAARAMDNARQRPAAAAGSSTTAMTSAQETRTRPDEPLNNPAVIARQDPPHSDTLITDPTTSTGNDRRDASAPHTTSPLSPSSPGSASGSGSRGVRQLREGSRTGNSGNF